MKLPLWLVFALVTTAFWGVWGALIELPEKAGFPATLGYSVWALTMIPPALVALRINGWRLDRDARSVGLGALIGFLGAGGQLVLFETLRLGPAYLIFPIISLSPVVTILMSCWLLRERTGTAGWMGIVGAIAAMPLLNSQPPGQASTTSALWFVLALLVFLAWGVQAFVWKVANRTMRAESIFFYMMATGLLLIPVALAMTDFTQSINWGPKGPWLAAAIQCLNSIGALCIVYAFRYGKAIIVSPLTNAVAPVITVVLSLLLYQRVPPGIVIAGMGLALFAAFLMAVEGGGEGSPTDATKIPPLDASRSNPFPPAEGR